MTDRQQIDLDCAAELDRKHRHQEHLARVAICYLSRCFGDDHEQSERLVTERRFDRLQVRIQGYGQVACRRPQPPIVHLALRHVQRFIRDQAPVIVPSRPDAKPARNNDGGRRQQARRGLVFAG